MSIIAPEKWQSQTHANNQSAHELVTKLTKFGVEIEQEAKRSASHGALSLRQLEDSEHR